MVDLTIQRESSCGQDYSYKILTIQVSHIWRFIVYICMLVWHVNSSSLGVECAKKHIKQFWDLKSFHERLKEIHPFLEIRHQHKKLQWTPNGKFLQRVTKYVRGHNVCAYLSNGGWIYLLTHEGSCVEQHKTSNNFYVFCPKPSSWIRYSSIEGANNSCRKYLREFWPLRVGCGNPMME